MKQSRKLISTILLAFCSTVLFAQFDSSKADTTKQHFIIADSLTYMNEIVVNKQKYIHQPLSVLLHDLRIPVKSFYQHHDKLRSFGIYIYSDNYYNIKEGKWNSWDEYPVSILLEWATPMLRSDIEVHLYKGAGEWTTAEQKYFGNEIVSDIVLPYRKQD